MNYKNCKSQPRLFFSPKIAVNVTVYTEFVSVLLVILRAKRMHCVILSVAWLAVRYFSSLSN